MNAAIVEDVRVSEYLDANTIKVSWSRDATLEREVSHYTIYHSSYSTRKGRAQKEQIRTISAPRTSEVFHLPKANPQIEYWFEVTVTVRVKGEEFQSERSNKLVFKYGIP